MKKVWFIILLVAFVTPIVSLGFSPTPAYAGGGDDQGGSGNDNSHGDNNNQ